MLPCRFKEELSEALESERRSVALACIVQGRKHGNDFVTEVYRLDRRPVGVGLLGRIGQVIDSLAQSIQYLAHTLYLLHSFLSLHPPCQLLPSNDNIFIPFIPKYIPRRQDWHCSQRIDKCRRCIGRYRRSGRGSTTQPALYSSFRPIRVKRWERRDDQSAQCRCFFAGRFARQ